MIALSLNYKTNSATPIRTNYCHVNVYLAAPGSGQRAAVADLAATQLSVSDVA